MSILVKNKPSYAAIESMTKFCVPLRISRGSPYFTVRVWREESEIKDSYDNGDLEEAVRACSTVKAIATTIAGMDRVSAVEVLDEAGNGLIIYVTW